MIQTKIIAVFIAIAIVGAIGMGIPQTQAQGGCGGIGGCCGGGPTCGGGCTAQNGQGSVVTAQNGQGSGNIQCNEKQK